MKKQKGFTLVELLVVIAILAILATVSIVGYNSFIKKANTSVDEQAVTQMNTLLQANEVLAGTSILDVYEAFEENGLDAEDYKPLTADRYFFWDQKINRIVYTDKDYNILFPTDSKAVKSNGWFSLSGAINQTEPENISNGNVTVTTGDELFWVVNNPQNISTVTLSGEIDMMGAELVFEPTSDLTITGGTLSNITNITAKGAKDAQGKAFDVSGLVVITDKDNDANITIKDITIKDSIIGDYNAGMIGGLVSRVNENTVTFENVHVINCEIQGQDKVGGFVGAVTGTNAEIIFKGECSIENTNIYASSGYAGVVVGNIYANCLIKGVENLAITNSHAGVKQVTDVCPALGYARKYVTGTFEVIKQYDKFMVALTTEIENGYKTGNKFTVTLGELDEADKYYVNYTDSYINVMANSVKIYKGSELLQEVKSPLVTYIKVKDVATNKEYVVKKPTASYTWSW